MPYDRPPAQGQRPLLASFPEGPCEAFIRCPGTLPPAAVGVTASAIFFYRYTGQTHLPIVIDERATGTSARLFTLALDLHGDMRCADLLETVADLLDAPAQRGAPDARVAISITEGDEPEERPGRNLDLRFRVVDGNLCLTIQYDATLFTRATAQRFWRHLRRIATCLTERPSTPVAEIELLSDTEAAELDALCTGPAFELKRHAPFREVEAWAASTPEKIAVRFNDRELNYAQLNARANQVAHYLLEQGIRCGDRVVVCLEPCLDVPPVILALFKVGAIYVPLNPDFPAARCAAIASDTDTALVVTQSHVRAALPFDSYAVLEIGEASTIDDFSRANPDIDIDIDAVACIYYTSGTTGKPKGVTGSHANLEHMLQCSRRRYGISPADTVTSVASYTFSISMFELMAPLTAGATLLLLERAHVLDPERMTETLRCATLFHIGPSLLRNIVQFIRNNVSDFSVYDGVRHASSGGDMVPPELLNDMRTCFRNAEIYVIYGCSEVSLMGCTFEMTADEVKRTYVGKPMGNVRLAILDDDGNRLPIGAVGDVCIGGPGVVTGYLNRPELVGESFFERDGVRFYRTGDRGRLNDVGMLELLGRRDFQVQIHGMRVEIGEIEYHLRKAPAVRDGVVVARPIPGGGLNLVAYLVADSDADVDAGAIRDYMLSQLPDYMVPARIMQLAALPLNQNLKIDRNALPAYEPVDRGTPDETRRPATPSERVLAEIWGRLLRVNEVLLDDNFILLGGDSILALEMIVAVQQRLGTKLDGLDVVRESLQVLAHFCDQSRTPRPDRATLPPTRILRDIAPVETFYFGRGDSLYGVFNPTGRATTRTPVLICGPAGHEALRCSHSLRVVAETLAAQGVPVLRFDYFGSGDSLGSAHEASLARWRSDIRAAADVLRERSAADRIAVLGIRLGASLAIAAREDLHFESLLAWDPVTDGTAHLLEQRRMQREKSLQLLVIRNLRRPRPITGAEELLGFTYSETAIGELESILLDGEFHAPSGAARVLLTAASRGMQRQQAPFGRSTTGVPAARNGYNCDWYDSTQVTSAVISRGLRDQVVRTLMGDGDD